MTFNDQQLKRLMAESSADPRNENLHLVLANRYQQLGLMGAAKDELLMILKVDPRSSRARRELAQLSATAQSRQPKK